MLTATLITWPGTGDLTERALIGPRARAVAVRGQEGLVPLEAGRQSYIVTRWLQRDGDEISPSEAAQRPGWTRERVWSLAMLAPGSRLAVTRAPRIFDTEIAALCGPSDVVVAPRARVERPTECVVLDADTLSSDSSMAITIAHGRPVLRHAQPGTRLWQGSKPAQ